MAYYRVLPQHKCLRCPKKATVEVLNSRNARMGDYCLSCGKKRVKEIERDERPVPNAP